MSVVSTVFDCFLLDNYCLLLLFKCHSPLPIAGCLTSPYKLLLYDLTKRYICTVCTVCTVCTICTVCTVRAMCTVRTCTVHTWLKMFSM